MNDTKEHILNASFSLFLQKNFKEVTMQEIVEKTGMSKGAFYHYFDSKEHLFLEVINHFTAELNMDYNKLSKDSLYQFYHDYIKCMKDTFLPFFQKQNGMDINFEFNYYVLIFDALKLFPSFREKMFTTLQVELNAWEDIVRIARSKGEIKSPMTDEQIASMFIYTGDGVGIHSIFKGSISNMTNNLAIMWDGLYQGLKT